MKPSYSLVFHPLRLLTLAVTLLCSYAYADEYADVAQLMRAGKLPEAMAKADQYLAIKPKDPQLRFLKGVIQRDSGKPMEAIASFTRLTEDYPELPEPYNNLAVLYAGQNQFDKARLALEMAIRTNPSYATAHENLGDVYAKLASQAYNKALQLDAANPAVPPKLALIRELFSTSTAKYPHTASTAAPALAAQPTASAPTALAAKPPPTLPGPAAAKTNAASVPPPVLITSTVAPAIPAPAASKPAPTPAAATPAVASAPATPSATPASSSTASSSAKEVEAAVRAWASAWAAKDVKAYLATYGKEFDTPGAMSRGAWEDERRLRISSKASISIKLENLNVNVDGNKATAKFRQGYKANGLAVSSQKTLDLVKNGDRWQIVKESTGG
jgi:Flp pilus assembly protein TadD/ketosteroid isomerase-like protein